MARALSLCLLVAAAAQPDEKPLATQTRVKAMFTDEAALAHKPSFVANEDLVQTKDLLEPFAKAGQNAYPFVKAHKDGGDTTRAFDGKVASIEEALKLVNDEKISLVLQLEHLDEDAWPAALAALVPDEFRDELTKKRGAKAGTTVHAYVSAPGVSALPTHADFGDVLVVQLAGKKLWTVGELEKTLEPGDALFVPAGEPHSARASDDEVSCHLTIHRVTDDQVETRRRRQLSYVADGYVQIDGSGKDLCEKQGFDEEECEQVGCCEWKGKCKSAVGKKNCLSASQESHCTPKKSEVSCFATGCCDWTGEKCEPKDDATEKCENDNFYCEDYPRFPADESEYCVNQPDSCHIGDRGCEGCSCMECNLCSDAGAFCTTSASDHTKADPCCAIYADRENHEKAFFFGEDSLTPGTGPYCTTDDNALFDAWEFRTIQQKGAKRGQNCNWIADKPEERCDLKGIFEDTTWDTIDTTSRIIRRYGKDQIYAAQPTYKAKEACPIACGEPAPCADDGMFIMDDRPSMGCMTVASDPEEYCGKKGFSPRSGKTKAKNACPVACGKCPPCEDDKDWFYESGKKKRDCDWVAEKSKRCTKKKIKSPDGVPSSVGCPKACGTC